MNATPFDDAIPHKPAHDQTAPPDSKRRMILLAVSVIMVGVGWLLNTLKLFPEIDWIWTGGLFVSGVLVLAGGGLNRLTFVAGPFLITTAATSLLRQLHWMRADIEAPVLFICFGVLLLLAYVLPLKTPGFLLDKGNT